MSDLIAKYYGFPVEKPLVKLYKMQTIGAGAYGVVRLNYMLDSDGNEIPIAIKQSSVKYKNGKPITDHEAEREALIQEECQILQDVDHQNIIHCHGAMIHEEEDHRTGIVEKTYSLVMSYALGSLRNYIHDENARKKMWDEGFTLTDADIMLKICSGVEYLHNLSPRIIHRDIKPDNILLLNWPEVCLGDFGTTTSIQKTTQNHTFNAGTIAYMAKEVMEKGAAGSGNDLWGIGTIIYEILEKKEPYSELEFTTNSTTKICNGR